MKTNRNFVNVLPLLIYLLAIILFALLPLLALADGAGTIAPVEKLTPKVLRSAETIQQREPRGELLPWKTFQTDDTPRADYWNGHGVDPSGVNWYYYWNPDTECLPGYAAVWEGTDHCKQKEEEREQAVTVPEPDGLLLLGGIIFFIWLLFKRRDNFYKDYCSKKHWRKK